MKSRAILFVCGALILASLASTASATLVAYEPFDYTSGQRVLGQSNASTGTNWLLAAGGAVTDTTAINVASGNLSTPPDVFPAASGNSATVTGIGNRTGASNRLAFGASSPTFSSGTVYYSLSLRIDSLSGSTNVVGGFFLALNNTGNSATTTDPSSAAARLQARIDPTDATKYNLGIFRNVNAAAAAASWSGPLTVGETLFVVGSYEIVSGAQNDIARLWINPSNLGQPSPPAATVTDNTTATGTDINIASVILRQSAAPFLTLDELRVGTDWASVTPTGVPEASAALFLLVGSVLVVGRPKATPLMHWFASLSKSQPS